MGGRGRGIRGVRMSEHKPAARQFLNDLRLLLRKHHALVYSGNGPLVIEVANESVETNRVLDEFLLVDDLCPKKK